MRIGVKRKYENAINKHLLDVDRREGNGFPEIAAIFTGHPIVFIKLLLNESVVLYGQCIPHQLIPSLNAPTNAKVIAF